MSLSTDFIQLIIKEGVGVALFLCCAVRLRYVPQAALRSFRDATGGCVSLRSTARPFAAPLPFAPPENEHRRVACCGLVRYATHPCTSRHTKHHSRGLPLAKCLAFSVQLATLLIYTLRHLTKYLHAHATIHTSHR